MSNPSAAAATGASSPSTIRSVVVTAPGEIGLVRRETPLRRDDEVLIRPVVVGICGTDLDIIDGTIDPEFVRYPLTLGHEWSGVIVETADRAPSTQTSDEPLSAGDRVVVEGIVPCGQCAPCKAGATNRCENYDEFGFTRHGAMGELVAAPEHLVHRLASHVSMESGVLVEPAAVVIRGLMRILPLPGERVLVIGDGTVALLAATIMQLWSPGQVTMLGQRADQSQLASAAGVTTFLTDAELVGHDFDIVIEAAGAAAAVATALSSVARGGRVVLLGFPGHGVSVPVTIDDIVNGDITISGSFGYTSSAWGQIVALLNSGRLDLGFLVTHRFPLERFDEGVSTLRSSLGVRGKILIDVATPTMNPATAS